MVETQKRVARWGIVVAIVVAACIATAPREIWAQGPNVAGLVVRLDDETVLTRCVAFTEDEINGYALLERSRLEFVASQSSGMGSAVCQIEGIGCPASNCFCACQGSTCTYWSYWYVHEGEWTYSPLGASSRRVRNGQIEGWSWGVDTPPPLLTLDQVCASPTPTVSPTATTVPTPRATARRVDVSTRARATLETTRVEPARTRTGTLAVTSTATASLAVRETVETPRATAPADQSTSSYVFLGAALVVLIAAAAVVRRRALTP